MSELDTNDAIARIAPSIFEHFHRRGLADFRVFPHRPAVLFVYVHFFGDEGDAGDLELLGILAARAGLDVERSCLYGGSAWIEISVGRATAAVAPERGAVVPFVPRRAPKMRQASRA